MTAHAQTPQSPPPNVRVLPPPAVKIPADMDAEIAVISAVILDCEALPKIIDFLRPEHFLSEAHRRIFEACTSLFSSKDPIDTTTVGSWLRARERLTQVGGMQYIGEILDGTPAPAHVRAHAIAVHDMWRRRQLMVACEQLAIRCAGTVAEVQRFCDEATKTVASIGAQSPVRPIESNEEALERIIKAATEPTDDTPASTTRMTGFPMGIHGLDRILGGARRSAKTTIVATTGVGKTALAIQVGTHVAGQAVGVLFFSTELKREELLLRALANRSGVSATRIRDRRLNDRQRKAMREAADWLKALPLRIDETARLTIEEVCAATKAAREEMMLVHRVPLGMVILDYVQRIEPSRHMLHREKHEQLGHISRTFKQLCQELDIAGIELAQGKDAVPGRKPEKPKASTGIADSSQIAKESDDVIFLLDEGAVAANDPRRGIEVVGREESRRPEERRRLAALHGRPVPLHGPEHAGRHVSEPVAAVRRPGRRRSSVRGRRAHEGPVSWGGNLREQIAADFRDAQRKRRGPTDMSEDRPAVVLLAQPLEETIVARVRRIVTSRRAA